MQEEQSGKLKSKKEVALEIKKTFSDLSAALTKFSEQELNTSPFEGSWTAGQTAEHIIKSIGGSPDEKTQLATRSYDEKIQVIREMFLNMEIKFKADPYLEPEQSYHEIKSLFNTLSELEKEHLSTAEGEDLEALCLDMELPAFGYLTRYEWLRFMMVHAQRHTKQIENIHKWISQKK